MNRDAEQYADELIAGADGLYDGVQPLVRRYAELSVELDRLHAAIGAMPDGAPGMLALAEQAIEAFAELDGIFWMLVGPGRPLPMS